MAVRPYIAAALVAIPSIRGVAAACANAMTVLLLETHTHRQTQRGQSPESERELDGAKRMKRRVHDLKCASEFRLRVIKGLYRNERNAGPTTHAPHTLFCSVARCSLHALSLFARAHNAYPRIPRAAARCASPRMHLRGVGGDREGACSARSSIYFYAREPCAAMCRAPPSGFCGSGAPARRSAFAS